MNDSIDSIRLDAQERMKSLVETLPYVGAEDIGLDPRAGKVYVGDSEIIVCKNGYQRSLEYYGGFEYVDEKYQYQLGDYVVYSDWDERVHEAIYFFRRHQV